MHRGRFKLTRRKFLQGTAAGGVLAGAGILYQGNRGAVWSREDLQPREVKFVRSVCSPNCTSACGIRAMVVDGQIRTLTPTNDYPEPEYGPRGCLRGLSFLNLMYGPDRLEKPLIRVGERGKGEFREATWEEALDYTAEKLKEVAGKYGADSIGFSFQVGGTGHVHKGAWIALSTLAGWTLLHPYDLNGDLPMFFPQTFGVQTEELEPIEWLNSRYTAVFGSNVMVTRLIDSDLLNQTRLKGAKLVVFDPVYSATAAKADEWIRLKPSSDAALALGMAKIIVEE